MENEVNLTASTGMKAYFELMFEDHAALSDFIFKKSGIPVELDELQQMTRSGLIRANDPPTLWLRRFVDAMKDEIRELEESIPWKWWRHQKTDIQNVHVELVDLFHFLVSAAQVAGLSGADFIELYYKKRKINYERQLNGFDPNDNKEVVL